jgi:integrase
MTQNHPQKGDTIKVEPIRRSRDIAAIKQLLGTRPRDLAIFVTGINTNLRASDLVRLTIGQVRHLQPLDDLELREQKTGKLRRITVNKAVVAAIQAAIASYPEDRRTDTHPLFQSDRRGRGGGMLTVSSVHRLVKYWCASINLRGNYGSHTLRKTWGYHQRVTYGVGLPELMVAFNHATQRQTLTYLCVQPDEVRSVYANEI